MCHVNEHFFPGWWVSVSVSEVPVLFLNIVVQDTELEYVCFLPVGRDGGVSFSLYTFIRCNMSVVNLQYVEEKHRFFFSLP